MPLWLRIRRILNVKKLPIICGTLALVTVVAIFGLNQTIVIVGRANYEQLQENTREYERVKEILNKKEKQEEEIRNKLFTFCTSTRNPSICRSIAEAGVATEMASDIEGFAKLLLAVSTNESLFIPAHIPYYNPIGAGWCDGCKNGLRFKSYQDMANWFAEWLIERGFKEIAIEDIKTINYRYHYASSRVWWLSIRQFWEEIG